MTATLLFRALTARGWSAAILVVLAVAVLIVAAAGLGLRWDPLGLTQRRLDQARLEADHARADAEARRVEQAAEVVQRRRLELFHQQVGTVDRVTAAAVNQARSAHDAQEPLDADTVRVLRAHDHELRRMAPHLGD